MAIKLFIERLRSHSELDDEDVRRIRGLPIKVRNVAAGNLIIGNGAETESCSLLGSGVAFGQKIAGDGARQILGMYFPGELVDFDGLLLQPIDHSVQANALCEVVQFKCSDLLNLIFSRQAIGKAIMQEASIKAAIAREWMTNIGCRNSLARVAHFLCELSLRLSRGPGSDEHGFDLPVTQEQLADVVGITAIHVGRVLRRLEAEGLIGRHKRSIEILDWQRLKTAGDFSPDYLRLRAS